jgi:hypothetical protein
MSVSELLMITPNPVLSGIIWFVVVTLILYLARVHAHRVIIAFTRVLQNAMRLSARSVMLAEAKLIQRNREVLLNQGREASERIVEREFERVDNTVRRDLAEYPALHRQLSEEINKVDEDYKNSIDVPPEPPGWCKAVEAVAKIPSAKGDPMVSNVLEDIHQSLIKANTRATEEYRKASHQRHQLLNNMMPHWRKVKQLLQHVDKNINSLLQRSTTIDRHMEEYESILNQTDRAVRTLSSSSLTQFFISAFVLAIAVGGAVINFHLIARPMSEMVGGTSMIMGMKLNNIAAMVIILVELAMGLFLMESLRITRMFPVIGSLNDKVRIRMVWTFFSILLFLACIEAGLAFMRELLMEEDAATRAILRGEENAQVVQSSYLWITTAAQMGMGFILPFALMFVAIPLETFVHSLRTVVGVVGVALLRALTWLLRLMGNMFRFSGATLVNAYDLLIIIPLWIERMFKSNATTSHAGKDDKGDSVSYGGAA